MHGVKKSFQQIYINFQWTVNYFEKASKWSLCNEFEKDPLIHFSSRESLQKPETGMLNLDFHQCFCKKRLFYPKRHLKWNYFMLLEENNSSRFFETRLPKYKIGLPSLDFNEFFCGKRLIHFKWHVKRHLFIEFEENR